MNYDKIIYYSLKSHKILNTKFKDKKAISNSHSSSQIIRHESSTGLWKKDIPLETSLQAAKDRKIILFLLDNLR